MRGKKKKGTIRGEDRKGERGGKKRGEKLLPHSFVAPLEEREMRAVEGEKEGLSLQSFLEFFREKKGRTIQGRDALRGEGSKRKKRGKRTNRLIHLPPYSSPHRQEGGKGGKGLGSRGSGEGRRGGGGGGKRRKRCFLFFVYIQL